MSYILNHYIVNKTEEYESVIKDANILKGQTLEQYIISKLEPYYNQDIEFLKHKFNIPYQVTNKSFTYLLIARINGEKHRPTHISAKQRTYLYRPIPLSASGDAVILP